MRVELSYMKKILFLLVLGAVIGYLIKSSTISLPFGSPVVQKETSQQVAGASTSATKSDFSVIEKAVKGLSISDIATSSPKIQNLIHLLQKLPKDQAKVVCENVCKSIQ